ncbi:MAG: hypothetical protein ACREIT_06355, partial [Tepidisphaeraceae bacterium]
MPPTTQGSRGAMITWIVILAILFITATIFAFYFNAESRRVTDDYDQYKRKYIPEVITESALTGEDVTALRLAREDASLGLSKQTSLLDVALAQRNRLATQLSGGTAATAYATSVDALAGAAKRLKDAGVTEQLPSQAGV